MNTPTSVESYINQFDDEIKSRLLRMRALIQTEAPGAVESFSYGLVGYKLNKKPLVYFGGFKNHVGFYATPNGHENFSKEFDKYKQGKGSVQFPLSEPLPIDLIRKVVRFRVEQVGEPGQSDNLPNIGSPALRALNGIGILTASQLNEYSEKDLLALHGVGPRAIRILKEAGVRLKEN